MAKLPDPLTPATLDLRGFTYMPLEVVRLRDSDLVVLASGEEFRAAVLLWCAAWHQVPAASVPKDERMLANLAGFGRDLKGWRGVSEAALRGFIECSDGRLYHPVIAEKAIESGSKKRKQTSQTAAATEARRAAKALRDAERGEQRNDERNVDRDDEHGATEREVLPERDVHQGNGMDLNGGDLKGSESKTRVFFVEFWKAYPRRDSDEAEDRAEQAFAALLANGVDPKVIIFGAMAYCAKCRKQNTYATRYVKQAWRWLGEQDFAGAVVAEMEADKPVNPADVDWRGAVKRWLLNESNWPRWAGNAPGTPSCRCPPEVLAELGVCPNTARRIDDTWHFAVIDTAELTANLHFAGEHKLKVRLYKINDDGVEREGAWFIKRFPPGYDEATGEKLAPTDAEDAA